MASLCGRVSRTRLSRPCSGRVTGRLQFTGLATTLCGWACVQVWLDKYVAALRRNNVFRCMPRREHCSQQRFFYEVFKIFYLGGRTRIHPKIDCSLFLLKVFGVPLGLVQVGNYVMHIDNML